MDESNEEEESEEDNVSLKCKWKGEESELKKVKTSQAKDSKDPFPLVSTSSPKKKSTNPFSPIKSKFSKAINSQTPPKFQTL